VELLYYLGVMSARTAVLATALFASGSLALPAGAVPKDFKAADTLMAEVLSGSLGKPGAPVILHVGFPAAHRDSRIPGAKGAGPAYSTEGRKRLSAVLAGIPRDREIVIYCGCCPWEDCPNILPAFKIIRAAGFKRVRALALPTDYTIDWVNRGYPVEKGIPKRE